MSYTEDRLTYPKKHTFWILPKTPFKAIKNAGIPLSRNSGKMFFRFILIFENV